MTPNKNVQKLRTPVRPWTCDEALALLKRNGTDTTTQYIALQMARRHGRLNEVTQYLQNLNLASSREKRSSGSNLMGIFSGVLAVQESLQLDAMQAPTQVDAHNTAKQWHIENVPVAGLTGPSTKSHPWTEMLNGSEPQTSAIASYIPEDFMMAESNSATTLLEMLAASGLWATVVNQQAFKDGRTTRVAERLKKQLVLDDTQLEFVLKSDQESLHQIAITGSDLYITEGGDVTVLILGAPDFTETLLTHFKHAGPTLDEGIAVEELEVDGVRCVHISTSHRQVDAYAANPMAGLHVRSNCFDALNKVLATIKSRRGLSTTDEFKYVRKLMPWSSNNKDVFVYFSDPFIRHLTGPELRLTQRRRMMCHNHLKMIGHAILLHATEQRRLPDTFEDLYLSDCAPGVFNQRPFICPCGGDYNLIPQLHSVTATCSVHGTEAFLTPCIEIPLAYVSRSEASQYEQFLTEYNSYWRTYFDPIGIRMTMDEESYQAETIVLPLIDNSIYTALAAAMQGETKLLEPSVVPAKTIFTTSFKLDFSQLTHHPSQSFVRGLIGGTSNHFDSAFNRFLMYATENQFSFHVYDADPTFGLDMPALFGFFATLGQGGTRSMGGPTVWIAGLIASLNAPVYASIPLVDTQVADQFLAELERAMTAPERMPTGFISRDFSRVNLCGSREVYAIGLQFGPAKLRIYWARIGEKLYMCSKLNILEDLFNQHEERTGVFADQGSASREAPIDSACHQEGIRGHAMVQVRSENWKEVCKDALTGWRENCRKTCHKNLAPLTVSARALHSLRGSDAPVTAGDLMNCIYANSETTRLCPETGVYSYDADSGMVSCSVHGTADQPRQKGTFETSGFLLMEEISRITAALTFIEEGLHARLIVRRTNG